MTANISVTNQVIIIGGTSGIGLATAKMAAKDRALVVIVGRDDKKTQEAVESIGANARGFAFDATDRNAVGLFFGAVGPFDHLVLALSSGKGAGPFDSISEQDIREGFNGKFFVHWLVAQASLKTLKPAGSITFVSAASARVGNPGTAGLAAINGAIQAMIKPLAAELKPIRINAVSPGVIDTGWWNRPGQEAPFARLKQFAASTPVGRAGRPEEVASAICFLMGNAFMTGTIIDCDGGMRVR